MANNNLLENIPKNVSWALTIFLILVSIGQIFSIINEIKKGRYIGQEFERVHTITVSGKGKIERVPDLAEMTISVFSKSFDLKKAQEENSIKANAIINFLSQQGIKKEDIKTSQYNIYPQYDYSQYGRKFLGYEIRNSLNVKVRDFGKIGLIIEKAVELGANEVYNLIFTIDKKEEVQNEARKKAIDNAREKAKVLADQLGVVLVRITNFSENSDYDLERSFYITEKTGIVGGSNEMPQIEPGQNEIKSSVSITYEIATK